MAGARAFRIPATLSGGNYERVKQALSAARHLSGSERAAYLDEHCAGDDALRREVESLLPHGDAPSPLDQGAPLVSPAALARVAKDMEQRVSAAPGAGATPHLPKRLGPFRIIRLIARGGMGTVYEAEQDDPKRRVALKTLRPDLFSPGLARRFQLESRILGLLKHPGIAQVYGAGTVELDGEEQPYFAMELVDGKGILEWVDERKLDSAARLRLFVRVCDAVEHAHLRGVIHRDLKPDNILVTNDGDPKVLDFGVARVTDSDIQATTIVTQAGQIMGTLAYMSPEQVSGDSSKLDLRTDVYALGVVLFELLSNQKPYDLARCTLPEATRIILDKEASRLGSLDTRFRGDLETIVGKSLEKDIGRRYVSAADLAADVRRHLSNQPIKARAPSRLYLMRKFARRHTGLVVGSSLAVLALLAGLGFSLSFAFEEAQQRHEAEFAGYRALLAGATAALDAGDLLGARALLDDAPESLRGWEWQHTAAQAKPLLWELPLHLSQPDLDGPCFPALAFSPDERLLAVHVDTDRIHVFLAESGLLQHSIQLSGPLEGSCLAATAVGFVTLERDGRVVHWDGHTGEVLQQQTLPDWKKVGRFSTASLEWGEAGQRLAVTSRNQSKPNSALYVGAIGSIRAVDVGSTTHFQIELTDDDQVLVSMGDRESGHGITVSDVVMDDAGVPTLRLLNRIDAKNLYDEHGERLLVIPGDGVSDKLTIVDLDGHELVQLDPHLQYSVSFAAFSLDGRQITTISTDGPRSTMTVFDAASGRALSRWPCPRGSLSALSTTGRLSAIASKDRLSVFSLDSPPSTVLPGAHEYIYNLAWTPDGRTLWVRNFDLTSRGYDIVGGTVLLDVPAPGIYNWGGNYSSELTAWGVSADGRRLVATHGLAHGDPRMRVSTYNLVSGTDWRELPGVGWKTTLTNTLADLIRLPRTSRLEFLRAASAIGPSELPVEDLSVTRAGGSDPRVRSDPSGQLLVGPLVTYLECVDGSGQVPLLIKGRALPPAPEERLVKLSDASFSPDGRWLAAVRPSVHEGVVIHDVSSGDSVVELFTGSGPGLMLYAVAFSPDGRRLAVAGTDRVVSLFDTTNWRLITQLEGHRGYIKDIAWSPDGATLASAGGDGTVRLWSTRTPAERSAAAHAAAARREEQRPWVTGLFAELGDPHKVEAQVRAATNLDDDQLHAALRVVRELANECWERQASEGMESSR